MKTFIDTQFTTVTENGAETNVPDLGGEETDNAVQYSVYDRGDGTCLVRVTAPPTQMSNITSASVTTEVTDDDVDADDTVPFSQTGQGPGLENLDQPDVEVDEELDQFSLSDVLDAEEFDRAYIIHNWTRGPLEREDRRAILTEYNASDLRNLLYVTTEAERDAIVQEYGIDSLPGNLDTSTVARSVIQNQTVGRQVLQDQEVTALNKAAKVRGRERADEVSKHTRADMEGEMGHKCACMLKGRCTEHQEMLDYVKGRNGQGPPWTNDANPPAKGRPGGAPGQN